MHLYVINLPPKWQMLCLAAILHDVTINDVDLAIIDTAEQPEFKNLSAVGAKKFFHHPEEV